MSDSRRRYDAIRKELSQQLSEHWQECPERVETLSLLVSAIPKAKDLTQTSLASEMPLAAQNTSLTQRQRRWCKNERSYYEPQINPFMEAMSRATVPLILNTTGAGINCHLWTLAVGYQRRALPVAWQAGQGSRGHTDGQ